MGLGREGPRDETQKKDDCSESRRPPEQMIPALD